MALFRFELLDDGGVTSCWSCAYETADEARSRAVAAARLFASSQIERGFLSLRDRISVYEENGKILLSLPFCAAFDIIQ